MLLVSLGLSLKSPSSAIVAADDRAIRPGMTLEQANQILHGPPRNELDRRAVIWVPHRDGSRTSAFVGPGTVAEDFFPDQAEAAQRVVWVTSIGLVAADFGPDRALRGRYFSEVEVILGPTLWAWIASWPGVVRRVWGF